MALAAWPDKVLWINFPSSVHMEGEERIKRELRRILHEAAPGDRFLIGITPIISIVISYLLLWKFPFGRERVSKTSEPAAEIIG